MWHVRMEGGGEGWFLKGPERPINNMMKCAWCPRALIEKLLQTVGSWLYFFALFLPTPFYGNLQILIMVYVQELRCFINVTIFFLQLCKEIRKFKNFHIFFEYFLELKFIFNNMSLKSVARILLALSKSRSRWKCWKWQYCIYQNKRPCRLIFRTNKKHSKTHQKPSALCTPPFGKSPIKSHRLCVLPPFENSLFLVGAHFGKYSK